LPDLEILNICLRAAYLLLGWGLALSGQGTLVVLLALASWGDSLRGVVWVLDEGLACLDSFGLAIGVSTTYLSIPAELVDLLILRPGYLAAFSGTWQINYGMSASFAVPCGR